MALLLAGCSGSRLLMPTPNVHLDEAGDTYRELAPPLKTTEVPLYYVTDRVPQRDEEGRLRYGYGRSDSLAFGTAV